MHYLVSQLSKRSEIFDAMDSNRSCSPKNVRQFIVSITVALTLDALFYKDTIMSKLKAIGVKKLPTPFSAKDVTTEEATLERICDWLDGKFGGYSIYHVDGRFRGSKLSTQEEAANFQKTGQRYLVDETTAVTRFIFPCKNEKEAGLVRFYFKALFVESIIQLINAEDEIWMVESGMENRIHIWRVE